MYADLYAELMRLERQMHRFRLRRGEDGAYCEQHRILSIISAQEGIIQRELCLKLDMRPSSVTEMLRKLESQGWIERRPDEKDQRVQHVHMTETGKEQMAVSEKEHMACTQRLFAALDKQELRDLLRLVRKLTDGLDTADLELKENELPRRRHRGFGGWQGGRRNQ